MGDRRPVRRPAPVTTAPQPLAPFNSLVASVQNLDTQMTRSLVIQTTEWQAEAWNYYRSLGELHFAVHDWLGSCMSRVRLIAAVVRPGEDPSPVVDGPVAQLVSNFAGGIGGQAEVMERFAVQLSIPGESYCVGEDDPMTGVRKWRVCSSDEVRIKSRGILDVVSGRRKNKYEIMIDQNEWRDLAAESLVFRVWKPDDQYAWKASSACESAIPIMREVDYYNRYIIAVLLSRLALNGIFLIPQEVEFPVNERYKDAADPFVAELLDIATKSIANPGSASAALPMPIRVPAQYIEMFKHLTFDTIMHEDVLENRMQALKRLATALNIPAEILLGVADMNHWGQWQLEESSIKTYISPLAEIICSGITEGFLWPMLAAAGTGTTAPDGGQYVIWYDTSNLSQQPDRTGTATSLYDRGELSGEALRREAGFEEADAPSADELKNMILKRIALGAGAESLKAAAKLTGDDSLNPPEPAAGSGGPVPPGSEPAGPAGPPGSNVEPPAPGPKPNQAPTAKPVNVTPGNKVPIGPPSTKPTQSIVPPGVFDLMEQEARGALEVDRQSAVRR